MITNESWLPDLAGSPLVSASLMLAIAGMLAIAMLRFFAVQSWRVRSLVAALILFQGLMLVRSPIHLGLVAAPVESDFGAPIAQPLASAPPLRSAREAPASDIAITSEADSSTAGGWWQSIERIPLSRALIGLWLFVVVTIVGRAVLGYVGLVRMIGRLKLAPEQWQQQWHRVTSPAGSKRALVDCQMLVCDDVGPVVVRCPRRYVLVVPESYWSGLSLQQRRGVMLHELAHLERHDVWRQLAARSIALAHWFNPLAWWAMRQYELASECACDQRVASDGGHAATGFASALVDLLQWHQDHDESSGPDDASQDRGKSPLKLTRGVGFQAMAAPPLTVRVSRLLQPQSTGDSVMKRLILVLFCLAMIAFSCVQFRLTTAQEATPEGASATLNELQVLPPEIDRQLREIAVELDDQDATSKRFASLLASPNGKLAIAGYLDQLRGRSREEARSNAVPRFLDLHFTRGDDGKLVIRPQSLESLERWESLSHRLQQNVKKIKATMDDIATKLDTSTEAGGLFKRLLEDPQAPPAILLFEMKNGGDVIGRFISEALDRIMVDQGDGTFRIVSSRRADAEKLIGQFEFASEINEKLKRHLPTLASEYSTEDESHRELVQHLRNPVAATIVAIRLAMDGERVPAVALEKLHASFEGMSTDTPSGLKIEQEKAWTHLREIFGGVDRAESILVRVRERLAEVAETLSSDDELTKRLAVQLRQEPMAVHFASELPYADSDPGEELAALLSEVLTESDGKLKVRSDREQEFAAKARELLQTCRAVRRHVINVDEVFEQLQDQEFVESIGDAGRYVMLGEVRRYAEHHHADPIALLRDDLLEQNKNGRTKIRDDRREVVRRLVEQSEKMQLESGNDDF